MPDLLSSRGKIATATIVLTRLRLPVSKTSFAVCPLLCPMNRYYPKMVSITAQSFWHFCGKPSQKFSRRKTPLCARSQTFKLRSEILFPAFYLLLDVLKLPDFQTDSNFFNEYFPTTFPHFYSLKEQFIHIFCLFYPQQYQLSFSF